MGAAVVHTVHSGWTRNIIALAASLGADAGELWRVADALLPEPGADEERIHE